MKKSVKTPPKADVSLPFNPVSLDYRTLNNGLPIPITPAMALYILINHNDDNRPISKTQVGKIKKGIDEKFRKDGQPITFNTEGNLTEKQHTLEAISRMPNDGRSYPMLVVVGVEPDCFSTSIPAKTRTPKDEVQRKDKSCTATEYSTVACIVARQSGKITNNNAVSHWELWKNSIRSGIRSCDEFWNATNGQVFTQIKSTVHAFAAISQIDYKEGYVRLLLDQIADHLNPDETSTPLAASLYSFFINHTGDGDFGHNKQKEKFLFKVLCVALDRIIANPDGDDELGLIVDHVDIEDSEKMLLSEVDNTETYKKYTTINPMTKR